MSELIKLEEINPLALFQENGLDPLLEKITEEVKLFVPDISTAAGRKEITAMCTKITKSRDLIEEAGKGLVKDWKAKSKIVDTERKRSKDHLNALKVKVRESLTAHELAEKEREKSILEAIEHLQALGARSKSISVTANDLTNTLEELRKFCNDFDFMEFDGGAEVHFNDSVNFLIERRSSLKQEEEKERIALEEKQRLEEENRKLKEEASQREAKERDEKLKRDAVENERKNQEDKRIKDAADSKARIEKAEKDQEEANERAANAIKKLEQEKKEAAENERKKIEAEELKKKQEQEKRESDLEHRKKINNEALKDIELALTNCDKVTTFDIAKFVLTEIARGNVKNVTVNY